MTTLVALTCTVLRKEEKGRENINEHNCGVKGVAEHPLLWMRWCKSNQVLCWSASPSSVCVFGAASVSAFDISPWKRAGRLGLGVWKHWGLGSSGWTFMWDKNRGHSEGQSYRRSRGWKRWEIQLMSCLRRTGSSSSQAGLEDRLPPETSTKTGLHVKTLSA